MWEESYCVKSTLGLAFDRIAKTFEEQSFNRNYSS